MLTETLIRRIIEHFASIDFWRSYWDQAAVAIVGSSVRGMADAFTDVDILVFVPQTAYSDLCERYRSAIQSGSIRALNAVAFQFGEFPLILIPDVAGHYKLHTFEEIEAHVQGYDDVIMWIHSHARILHDPTQRYQQLQANALSYPEPVWREKVRFHYLEAYKAAVAASNPLRRRDRPAVTLTMTSCVAHLLRLCCLLDRQPFPYDKWLYAEALQTQAGRALQDLFEQYFQELWQPEIRRVIPDRYERPGHRNADLEEYPLYRFWRQAKQYLDAHRPV